AMVVPFLVKKDWKSVFVYVALSAAVCVLCELPFIIADPSTAFSYLTYHSDRGIQVESMAASLLFLYNYLVPGSVGFGHSYGSENLMGSAADAVARFADVLMPVVLMAFLLFFIVVLAKKKVEDEKTLMAAVCLASEIMVMLFIICGKVYSAQYAIWILALVPAILFQLTGNDVRHKVLAVALTYAIVDGLATFAYNSIGFNTAYDLVVFAQLAKNLVHVGLVLYLVKVMCGMLDVHIRFNRGTDTVS
ncbi:MAG: hypothetical protein IJ856_04870, partial [Candidatus Methanomethylophilaceae archaeon]|nr:hypothetical protein [Candidatus Methanomethylophilaceae archaeon]